MRQYHRTTGRLAQSKCWTSSSVVRLVVLVFVMIFSSPALKAEPASPTITIVQFIEHSALEAIVKGFQESFAGSAFQPRWQIENAQGNISLLSQIGKKVSSTPTDLLLVLSTPAAQAMLGVARDGKIPLLYGAVTDPVGARIVDSHQEGSNRVYGLTDQPPLLPQLELMQQMVPGLKKIAVAYNPGESNSVKIIEELGEKTKLQGLEMVAVPVTKTSEAVMVIQKVVGEVQAIYLPQDNTVIAAIQSILQTSQAHGMPVFTSVTELVERGAVAAIGYNFEQIGTELGEMAIKVLKGQSESLPAISFPSKTRLLINGKVCEKLGIKIPPSIKVQAERIYE